MTRIRASARAGPEGAWCAADIDGATFNTAWQAFGTWTQPVATDSAVTLAEDASAAVPLVASDVDGDTLTYTLLSQPAHGSLSGEGAARTYTPAADYNGADSFTFRVSDGAMSSPIATVRLTVTPVNDAPTVELAPAGPVDEGASVTLNAQAADVDGDPVSLAWSTDRGTLAGTGNSATFTAGDGPGAAHVTVTGDDGTGGTATTALDVEVRNVAPVVDAGPDAEVVWGLAIDLSGSATDPSAADTAAGLVATWDVGDGSPAAGGPTASHAYAVPGPLTRLRSPSPTRTAAAARTRRPCGCWRGRTALHTRDRPRSTWRTPCSRSGSTTRAGRPRDDSAGTHSRSNSGPPRARP